jgi:hypothetical protein
MQLRIPPTGFGIPLGELFDRGSLEHRPAACTVAHERGRIPVSLPCLVELGIGALCVRHYGPRFLGASRFDAITRGPLPRRRFYLGWATGHDGAFNSLAGSHNCHFLSLRTAVRLCGRHCCDVADTTGRVGPGDTDLRPLRDYRHHPVVGRQLLHENTIVDATQEPVDSKRSRSLRVAEPVVGGRRSHDVNAEFGLLERSRTVCFRCELINVLTVA